MIEPKESVKKMEPYDPPLEGRRGLVRLDFNENTIGPSPKVLETLRNLSNEDIAIIGNRMRQIRNFDFYDGGSEITEKESHEYLDYVDDILRKIEKVLNQSVNKNP